MTEAIDLALPDGPDVVVDDVSFYSDGWALAAKLVAPADPGPPRPAVVWSHGWSGAVNFRVLPLAARLAQAGIVSLAVDHRGFGDSEGPRARCDPQEQVRDVSHAVTYLGTRDDIDAAATGVAGASFGGAISVAAAAAEPRLRACICIVGMGDGARWLRGLRPLYEWQAFRERLARDEVARVLDGGGERVELSVMMPGPPSPTPSPDAERTMKLYPDGYPLENAALAMAFRPEAVVDQIAPRATCFVTHADDAVVPAEDTLEMYARAGDPKELHVFPGGGHGGSLGPLVDETAAILLAFLQRHLASGVA